MKERVHTSEFGVSDAAVKIRSDTKPFEVQGGMPEV